MKCELCGGERLATSHDAKRMARKNVIENMTGEDLRALYRSYCVASTQHALESCTSDDERLALIRDMTKGYCLACGGVDPDGHCPCRSDD